MIGTHDLDIKYNFIFVLNNKFNLDDIDIKINFQSKTIARTVMA